MKQGLSSVLALALKTSNCLFQDCFRFMLSTLKYTYILRACCWSLLTCWLEKNWCKTDVFFSL